MNKYQSQSKVRRISDNLIDPMDLLAQDDLTVGQQEAHDARVEKIKNICGIARNLFETLQMSGLDAEDRATAMALLNVLQNRLGK